MAPKAFSFLQQLEQWPRVLLFGASEAGRHAVTWLSRRGVEILAFWDNDERKHGDKFCDIEVLPPTDWPRLGNPPVLITSCFARDIAIQLQRLGVTNYIDFSFAPNVQRWQGHFDSQGLDIDREEIAIFHKYLQDQDSRQTLTSILEYRKSGDPAGLKIAAYDEYRHPQVAPQPGDIVIDGGAWHGDSTEQFAIDLQSRGKIYAFEPDPENYHQLLKRCPQTQIRPSACGLWRQSGKLSLVPGVDSMESRLVEDGSGNIEVVALDNFVRQKACKPDLIKMDIEGAERPALEGAEELLRRHGPKLQICVYHLPDDLWRIPEYIQRINPDYRFFLGHHSQNIVDTVLYATTAPSAA